MISIDNLPYTRQQIINAIHGKTGNRQFKFRYDLLDKNDRKIGELDSVISGEVSMSAMSDIKRTAKFKMKDRGDINWLSDRIQPFVLLKIPGERHHEVAYGKETYFFTSHQANEMYGVVKDQDILLPGGYIGFPLGIFLLSTPKRQDDNRQIFRDVEAYDGLLILRDDKFESRYFIAAGTKYTDAVEQILTSSGILKHNIEQSDKVLLKDLEFEPGSEKILAVNNLLSAINFTPIHVDVYGYFTSRVYRSPSDRAAEYTYKDDNLSILVPGMDEELDLFGVANKWVGVFSDAELEPLSSTYINASLDSPTSTVNRGRNIVDYREVKDIADQSSLDAYMQRIAFEASQIYGKLVFETGINPLHDYFDVLNIGYNPLGINDKYSETSWTLPLKAGATMKHECRKIVSI